MTTTTYTRWASEERDYLRAEVERLQKADGHMAELLCRREAEISYLLHTRRASEERDHLRAGKVERLQKADGHMAELLCRREAEISQLSRRAERLRAALEAYVAATACRLASGDCYSRYYDTPDLWCPHCRAAEELAST